MTSNVALSRRWALVVVALAAAGLLAPSLVASPHAKAAVSAGVNDPSCRPSTVHPSPIVVLHGLGANANEDLNVLQGQLAQQGYCTFALTYGADPRFPSVGGVRPIAESAPQIAAFIAQVLTETGAPTANIVGHSEGAFQALYVTKTQGIAAHIGRVVAIAPPTHGTTFGGLTTLAYLFGSTSRQSTRTFLDTVGCYACDDLIVGGSAVQTLDDGPIAQPGVAYTIIASRDDEMVTPTDTAFVHEPGVTNGYVQDVCPLDPVGHLGEAYDSDVWQLVENALDPARAKPIACTSGFPG
ncbi:MAG: lipase [Acidimicrobiales bacterium]|nr:lipase [Acidimicrobiales bacterium]